MLTIFVADGAGSATCGGNGAELAVEAAANFVRDRYPREQDLALTPEFALKCMEAVRIKIFDEATRQGAEARDYACTFLGVVASPFTTLLMQIGDGGIVVDFGEGLSLPIIPMAGEYVNMTNFITDDDALDVAKIVVRATRPSRVAVFSDGIQRLAVDMVSHTPYAPFFEPFFAALIQTSAGQEDYLHSELVRFLRSQPVNERTNDDKTLALACWIA